MHLKHLKQKLKNLPKNPGIYKFLDNQNKILYIGKAKNISKRVRSYFNKKHLNYKTSLLAKNIEKIDFIIVDTEQDALLLENKLIKKFQPKYNIQLKDHKTYPYICIKNEPLPRVVATRRKVNNGAEYFGPYSSMKMVKTILKTLTDIFQIRSCTLNLSKENINKKKFKVCLEYHMKRCKGPCEGMQTNTNYNLLIKQVKFVLKGDIKTVVEYLDNKMRKYAKKYLFEEANEIKRKLDLLLNYQNKSTVINPKIDKLDIFTIDDNEKYTFVNILQISNGIIITSQTIKLKKQINEDINDVFLSAIIELRNRHQSSSKEIILPFNPNFKMNDIKLSFPRKGDKKKLLDLSYKQLRHDKVYAYNNQRSTKKGMKGSLLKEVKRMLKLPVIPSHIECFDNSNIHGTHAVASLVVFKEGYPEKKDYRKYHIKSVQGPDDFASMKEVIYRRYKRLVKENQPLPQLIIIDGGKGQLNAALKSLDKLKISNKMTTIGLAKKQEQLFFRGDKEPIELDTNSEVMTFLRKIRDEAHRFAISFHRSKRSKAAIRSELTNIKGIGGKTIEILIKEWGSIKTAKSRPLKQLEKKIGPQKALLIKDYFKK